MKSLSFDFPVKLLITLFCLTFFQTACSQDNEGDKKTKLIDLSQVQSCQFDTLTTSDDGKRRMALIIGVGDYKDEKIRDLKGSPEDAKRFYSLLTNKDSYQFPAENVCMLLDEQASKQNVINAFKKRLIEPAKQDDIAVFYFAGHGSQITDLNNDEADNMDETLVMYDSRLDNKLDLVDDEFYSLITQLYAKTRNVSIFLDSCNSGTATRGKYVSRFIEPLILKPTDMLQPELQQQSRGMGDSSTEVFSESMPGLVIFTAASDGTSAIERSARGVFTDAVLSTFTPASATPMTYLQASRQIPALVNATESSQKPYFQGNLEQFIFSSEHIKKPHSWEITKIEDAKKDDGIHLSGTPLPGLDAGAELRVFPGTVSGSDTRDLKKSKGTLVIDSMSGLNAKGHMNSIIKNADKIAVGDFAVLISPSDQSASITVSLRAENLPGGIPEDIAEQLKKELKNNTDARQVVQFVPDKGDFELSYSNNHRISVIGPDNKIRAQFSSADDAIHNLWQHARQRAILQLRGEGGADFINNQTLQVQLVPADKQGKCSNNKQWRQSPANTEQIIPLCHKWQIKVTYEKTIQEQPKLLIGGVVQSSDGSSIGLPYDGRTIALEPGKTKVLNKEIFSGTLPLDTTDNIVIFGTQESNPVYWHLLTDISRGKTRSAGGPVSSLQKKVERYFSLTRGQELSIDQDIDTTTWTMSIVPARVEANSRFLQPESDISLAEADTREYTIQSFNILPYLPDDNQSSMYRVLLTADQLAKSSMSDGYPYTQHDWSQGDDEKNLAKGIDCSRSIWYAFTRSGLKYNHNNSYITTSGMVGDDSLMNEEFVRCDNEPLQTGDILVYRDDKRKDGHTIMVIDPQKRIAWGSHGWDGSGKTPGIEPDTGVEYQLIKHKKDWERWDRKTMFKQACWRYKQFISETVAYSETRGYQSLKNYCENRSCSN